MPLLQLNRYLPEKYRQNAVDQAPASREASHNGNVERQQANMKPYLLVVSVTPQYLPDQSNPDDQHYLFAYTVRISNQGSQPVQVISRHWVITDGRQNVQEVRGLGVVGQQPLIAPGESFEYTSACPLPTPVGTMRGTYVCVGDNGVPFDVPIPEFMLAMPRTLH